MSNTQFAAASLNTRLGTDLTFPIVNNFITVSGVDLLLQDIQQLLLTVPGERVNRPTYGCDLRNQIWENSTDVQVNGVASITTSLELFEPRITLLGVSSTSNDNTGLITFNIQFIINTTDSVFNLIFPFRTSTQLSFA